MLGSTTAAALGRCPGQSPPFVPTTDRPHPPAVAQQQKSSARFALCKCSGMWAALTTSAQLHLWGYWFSASVLPLGIAARTLRPGGCAQGHAGSRPEPPLPVCMLLTPGRPLRTPFHDAAHPGAVGADQCLCTTSWLAGRPLTALVAALHLGKTHIPVRLGTLHAKRCS